MLTTTEKALHPQSTLRMQLHKKNLRHTIESLMRTSLLQFVRSQMQRNTTSQWHRPHQDLMPPQKISTYKKGQAPIQRILTPPKIFLLTLTLSTLTPG
jgi:hypothetical protein